MLVALAGGDALDRCVSAMKSRGQPAYSHGVEPEPRKGPGFRVIGDNAAANLRSP